MLSTFSPLGRFINIEYDPDTNTITHSPILVNGANAIALFSGKDNSKNRRLNLSNADITFVPNTAPQWSQSHQLKINIPNIHTYGLDTPTMGSPTVRISYSFEGELEFQIHGTGEIFKENYTITLDLKTGLNHQNRIYSRHFFYPLHYEYDKDTGDLTGDHHTLYLMENNPYIAKAKSFIQKTYLITDSNAWGQVFDYDIIQQVKDYNNEGMREVWLSLKKSHFLDAVPNGSYNIKGVFIGIPEDENPNDKVAVEVFLTVRGEVDPVKIQPREFLLILNLKENQKQSTWLDILHSDVEPILTFSKNLTLLETNDITNGKRYTFETKQAEQLGLGEHNEAIVVKYKQKTKRIPVTIRVQTNEVLPTNYFFCKDNNTFSFEKKHSGDSFLEIVMIIGPKYQTYHFPFFKGIATVRHGDLVQPFLQPVSTFQETRIDELDYVHFGFSQPYEVTFRVKEKTLDGQKWSKTIVHYYYAGKRPKAFPFLTHTTHRTTTSESLVVLPYINTFEDNKQIREMFKGVDLQYRFAYTEYRPYFLNMVCFSRKALQPHFRPNDIVRFNPLKLEPKPDLQRHINAIFINQNYVPDWFTFDGFWEDECKMEHALSTDLVDETQMKKGVKKDVTIKLSTGFIFQEEVDLVRELIASEIIFLKINNQWKRAIPISEKTIAHNTFEVIFTQMVEFKLLEDIEKANDKLYR